MSETEEVLLEDLEIRTVKDLFRFMAALSGKDPDAQQTINDFMTFANPIERSNLPNEQEVRRVSYLTYVGASLYPNIPDNPFTNAANHLATGYMAKGGWKSDGFVKMVEKTPDLSDFQKVADVTEQTGIWGRLRGKRSVE